MLMTNDDEKNFKKFLNMKVKGKYVLCSPIVREKGKKKTYEYVILVGYIK